MSAVMLPMAALVRSTIGASVPGFALSWSRLAVDSQQGVRGKAEAADGCLSFNTPLRTMPVVSVGPGGTFRGALV